MAYISIKKKKREKKRVLAFQNRIFIRTKHNMQILGVIPFIKLQKNT